MTRSQYKDRYMSDGFYSYAYTHCTEKEVKDLEWWKDGTIYYLLPNTINPYFIDPKTDMYDFKIVKVNDVYVLVGKYDVSFIYDRKKPILFEIAIARDEAQLAIWKDLNCLN